MKIAVDLDETLVDYLKNFCEFYNSTRNSSLTLEDFTTFSFSATLGITSAASNELRREYFLSSYFDRIGLVEGAAEAMKFLFKNHEVVFMTARPEDHQEKTISFLEQTFPGEDYALIFAGYESQKGKEDYCAELGINVIIDDHHLLTKQYASKGLIVLLLNRPWNQEVSQENIIRCKDWKEILINLEEIENGK